MSADKRSVSTDALETLGTIIDENQKRDAIHVAVEPVVAGEKLQPGDHVTITDGLAYETAPGAGLGIVDPFLCLRVKKGERFWLLIYPRKITSLRHVWSHPSFPEEQLLQAKSEERPPQAQADDAKTKARSEEWLREFCSNSGNCPKYEDVMKAVTNYGSDSKDGYYRYENDGEYLFFGGQDASGDIPDEFWDHVEIVTGKSYPRAKYFACSC